MILAFYILFINAWKFDFKNNEIKAYIEEIKLAEELPTLFYELYNIDTNNSLESGTFSFMMRSFYISNNNPPVSVWISRMMYIPRREHRIIPKIINVELSLATKIEKETSSRQQLNFILEKTDFVNGQIGVKAAAKFYFNKELEELDKTETAKLIVMTRNPSLYNPLRRTEKLQIEVDKLLKKSN